MDLKDSESANLAQIITNQIKMGIEIEKTRVNANNELSLRPFPQALGRWQQYVKGEFCAAQMELVLPPYRKVTEAVNFATELAEAVQRQIMPAEKLWHYSCPPKLSAYIPIGEATPEINQYRLKCVQKYDVRQLLNNGVHINLSFSPTAVQYLVQRYQYADANELYLQIAQYFMLNRWELTYLFGATPLADASYFDKPLTRPVRSIRSSSLGFTNDVRGDYRSVAAYVAAIEAAIQSGRLFKPREYYEAVRLKSGSSKAPQTLLNQGITHLELRTFDSNPFVASAVTANQLRLLQVMALYFASLPRLDTKQLPAQLALAHEINERVALESVTHRCAFAREGRQLLTEMLAFVQAENLPLEYEIALQHFQARFENYKKTVAYKIYVRAKQTHRPQTVTKVSYR